MNNLPNPKDMKYNIENLKNTSESLLIGPCNQEQKVKVLELLNKIADRKVNDVYYGCISFNYVVEGRIGESTPNYSRNYTNFISYETFMEHNTVYRVKTWEELLSTEGCSLDLYGDIYSTGSKQFFVRGMKQYCGKEISKEEFDMITKFDTRLPTMSNWVFTRWMVTDKPLITMETRKIIGYKLKKEYPGREVGGICKYDPKVSELNFFWVKDNVKIPTEFQPDITPDWFEPVYEELKQQITVEVGNPKKRITIYRNGRYQLTDHGSSIKLIRDLKVLHSEFITPQQMHPSLDFRYKLERIWVGCESGTSIGLEDIELILNTYEKEFGNGG